MAEAQALGDFAAAVVAGRRGRAGMAGKVLDADDIGSGIKQRAEL